MIINALCRYYDILDKDPYEEISPVGYEVTDASYCAVISENGNLVELISLRAINNKRPQNFLLPMSMKKSGISASPVCDNFAYIFGVSGRGGTKKIEDVKFKTAKDLHLELYSGVDSTQTNAICAFFELWDINSAFENHILMQHYSEKGEAFTGRIVFRIQDDDKYLHEYQNILDSWIKKNTKKQQMESEYIAQCAITGRQLPIARLHKQLSGVKGASTMGASLVCFKKPSDESYNFKQSYNSAVSNEAMFKYTTALQHMLKSEIQRLFLGDDTVVFWAESAKKAMIQIPFFAIQNPNIDESETVDRDTIRLVQAVIKDGKKGVYNEVSIVPDTPFYIMGLAPNAGRISIRYFYNSTFEEFCERIKQHYDDIAIWNNNSRQQISISRLIFATVSMNSRDKKANPILGGALMRSIFAQSAYPAVFYNQLILRVKAEAYISYERAAGIKGYLIRKARQNNRREDINMYLNEETNDTAYVLGRVFAILEMVQKKALGEGINATIKDKYFSSACSNPALVFPNLLKLAQHHLTKIDGNYWDIILGQCLAKIEDMELPKVMNMENQGRFILGYYQQNQKLYTKKEVKENE